MVKQSNFLSLLLLLFPKFFLTLSIRGREMIESHANLFFFLFQLKIAKKEPLFKFQILTDLFGVGNLSMNKRFQLIYLLTSLRSANRMRVSYSLSEFTNIPSISDIFSSANWLERECWDMFGLFFKNHCDLRRLLTDYGFDGYPLRKDFPVDGYVQASYDDEYKRVILSPLIMTQDFRDFQFRTPWETINKTTR